MHRPLTRIESRRFSSPRPAARLKLLAVLPALSLLIVACGDGTPKFCESLSRQADMKRLGSALDAGDLTRAQREAKRFTQLANEAPAEIRPDLKALADGVTDIIELLQKDKQGADPASLERRREELTDRLSELGRRSTDVSAWASRECGVEL